MADWFVLKVMVIMVMSEAKIYIQISKKLNNMDEFRHH